MFESTYYLKKLTSIPPNYMTFLKKIYSLIWQLSDILPKSICIFCFQQIYGEKFQHINLNQSKQSQSTIYIHLHLKLVYYKKILHMY